jgi:hypothetical protein
LIAFLAYFLALKMEAVHSSKISTNFYWTTWHHIIEDGALQVETVLYFSFIGLFNNDIPTLKMTSGVGKNG